MSCFSRCSLISLWFPLSLSLIIAISSGHIVQFHVTDFLPHLLTFFVTIYCGTQLCLLDMCCLHSTSEGTCTWHCEHWNCSFQISSLINKDSSNVKYSLFNNFWRSSQNFLMLLASRLLWQEMHMNIGPNWEAFL